MGIAVLVGGGRLLERCACVCSFSCVWLCSLMDYIASQASLSMGFPGQEYLNGLPFPPPGDLPNPGNQTFSWFSCIAGRFFTTEPPGKPRLLPYPFLLPGEDMRCVPGEAVLLIGPRGQWYVLQTKVLDLFLVYVQILSLGWEDPLEEEMATHSSILALWITWMKEPGRLKSTGWQRVRHDLVTGHARTCDTKVESRRNVWVMYPSNPEGKVRSIEVCKWIHHTRLQAHTHTQMHKNFS